MMVWIRTTSGLDGLYKRNLLYYCLLQRVVYSIVNLWCQGYRVFISL